MKKEKILNERIFEKLEGLFDKVIYERKHGYESNPKPEVKDIDHIIRHYSSKCAKISIGATLMPGQWGVISAVPEIVLGMKKQAEMIYDVSAAFGKDNLMTPELLAGILLYSLSGESYGIIQQTNGKYVVNENTKLFDYALERVAKKIARMIFRSVLVRWLPGFSTVSQALISGRVTRKIGKSAAEILSSELEIIKAEGFTSQESEIEWLVNNGLNKRDTIYK
ncbi:MAG TPA: hypothetical protein VJ455_11365 [Ignavibacteria bacterium]|nr:hypothetical protein [Ignavibacteria bacterium]